MPKHQNRNEKMVIRSKTTKTRLVQKRSVLTVNIPRAPRMSVDETNEWIRKTRDREI
jgi:hypothetical protein